MTAPWANGVKGLKSRGSGGSPKGGGSVSEDDGSFWKVGLVNNQGKYFTAEAFGFKINASATTLKKKQIWDIETGGSDGEVYIRSHLKRYLTADRKGNVACQEEAKCPDGKWVIEYHPDGSGRWALCNFTHGNFFGGSEDGLHANDKQPRDSEWWTVHLAVHPQLNLLSVTRKRYARLGVMPDVPQENQRLQFDQETPWGQDSLITLEFRDGRYAIRTWDNRYLDPNGDLTPTCTKDNLFNLELRSGQASGLAFRDMTGSYLTCVGIHATMQRKNKTISKDELFTLQDSHPQVMITSLFNNRKVSLKTGEALTANHEDEITSQETFQLEYSLKADKWRLRTFASKYWRLADANGIVGDYRTDAAASNPTPALFSLEYQEDGSIALKASNDKYVSAKQNGPLYATATAVTNKESFYFSILNRPVMVLRGDHGFVGMKTPSNARIECNKHTHDIIFLEHEDGKGAGYFMKMRGPISDVRFWRLKSVHTLKGTNDLYWTVDGEGHINADSTSRPGTPFYFQLVGQSRLIIKAPNGKYMKGEQNGIFSAKAEHEKATKWEY